jgi:molybdopterin synthase catalytic subunit
MIRSAIVTRAIDTAALLAEVSDPACGALSLFAGTVRDVNDGRAVTGIQYSAYKEMAEKELQRIVGEASERFGAESIAVEHRVGELALGDVSVAIAAAHPRRAQAMDCTRYVIEEIKKRLPVWKLEHYADGTREWVDPSRQVASTAAGGQEAASR